MNQYIMIISAIFSILLPFSCSKSLENNDCSSGTNPNIYHKCVNQTVDKKGDITLDLNDDGNIDFKIRLEKSEFNGNILSSYAYLYFHNASTGNIQFDFLAQKVKSINDSAYRPVSQSINAAIDSSKMNWLLKMTNSEPNLVLYYFVDMTSQGSNIKSQDGLIDIGDFYIAFRYYELDKDPKGWKNGWIKLNVNKDRIILKEIAYHKNSETQIKIGEK